MRIENTTQFPSPLQTRSGVVNHGAPISLEIQNKGDQHQISEKELQLFIDKANESLAQSTTRVQFSIHDKTHQIMVKLVDINTNEVLKEIPPEKMVDLVYNLCEQMGIFVDQRLS